jgi:hypothetical protein
MTDAREFLAAELGRLGASRQILSTNVELRIDGLPYANRAAPTDPGAAVYFQFKSKPVTLACDKWNRVEDNIWAIARHIAALRQQQRDGVGTIEQAFRGYMQIPERTSGSAWWNVLGIAVNATAEQVTAAYRHKAKHLHPDTNGGVDTNGAMAELNLAYAEAQKQMEGA